MQHSPGDKLGYGGDHVRYDDGYLVAIIRVCDDEIHSWCVYNKNYEPVQCGFNQYDDNGKVWEIEALKAHIDAILE
jgi:hypothetical protein